jgi:hypothetical protein
VTYGVHPTCERVVRWFWGYVEHELSCKTTGVSKLLLVDAGV